MSTDIFINLNFFYLNQRLISDITHSQQDIGRRKASSTGPNLRSGVILLAQELSLYDWLDEEIRLGAFNMPEASNLTAYQNHGERVDVRYQTAPAGVKPFPTPPETPADSQHGGNVTDWSTPNQKLENESKFSNITNQELKVLDSEDGSGSGRSSLSGDALDDEAIKRLMRQNDEMKTNNEV